jgi:cytochrome c553
MNLPVNLSLKKRVLTCLISLMASSLSSLVIAADLVGDANKGASKVSLCAGCHAIPGYRSSVPEIYTIPMIGGQSAAYLVSALQAYKKGERKHPTMRGIAGSLSDQDMVDIAAYYAGQSASSKPNYLK